MAGSLRYFSYTDDESRVWNVNLNENIYEVTDFGMGQQADVAAETAGRLLRVTGKRQPVKMRYALIKGTDADGRVVSRKVYVGSTSATAWTAPQNVDLDNFLEDFSSQPSAFLTGCQIVSLHGEVRNYIPGTDTGIIDGDVESTFPAT